MPRPTPAQLAYGSATVVCATLAMLLLSRARSGAGVALIAVVALAVGLLVALTAPVARARTVRRAPARTEGRAETGTETGTETGAGARAGSGTAAGAPGVAGPGRTAVTAGPPQRRTGAEQPVPSLRR